jgi:hypothetical protein
MSNKHILYSVYSLNNLNVFKVREPMLLVLFILLASKIEFQIFHFSRKNLRTFSKYFKFDAK